MHSATSDLTFPHPNKHSYLSTFHEAEGIPTVHSPPCHFSGHWFGTSVAWWQKVTEAAKWHVGVTNFGMVAISNQACVAFGVLGEELELTTVTAG